MLRTSNRTIISAALINHLTRTAADAPQLADAINGRLEKLWPVFNARRFQTELNDAAGHVLSQSGAKLAAVLEGDVLRVSIEGELLRVPDDFHNGLDAAKSVQVNIDCIGGDATVAFEIIDALQASGLPVRTHVVNGASAGALITQAGTHRTMAKDGLIVLHRATCCALGDEAELQKAIANLRPTNDRIVDLLMRRTGQPKEAVISWLTPAMDSIFDGRRALAAGLTDEIF